MNTEDKNSNKKDFERNDAHTNGAHIGRAIAFDGPADGWKAGDHAFTADLESAGDGTPVTFKVKEYNVLAAHSGQNQYYEIEDVRFPGKKIKSDLALGYFTSKKDACQAMVASLDHIAEQARVAFKELKAKEGWED